MQVERESPGQAQINSDVADLWLRGDQHRRALLAAQRGLRSAPAHPSCLLIAANNLAWLLAREFQQPNEAIRVLETARSVSSVCLWLTTFAHTLAVAYRAAGRDSDARLVLEESLATHPGEPKLLDELTALSVQ